MVGRIIEATFVLIMMYLVLSRATEFSSAAGAVGSLYQNAVLVLQGRG